MDKWGDKTPPSAPTDRNNQHEQKEQENVDVTSAKTETATTAEDAGAKADGTRCCGKERSLRCKLQNIQNISIFVRRYIKKKFKLRFGFEQEQFFYFLKGSFKVLITTFYRKRNRMK